MSNNDTNKYSKEDAYKTLELTNSWIGNVDTKSSLGLAFIVALLAIIFYNAGTMPVAFQNLSTAIKAQSVSCCTIIGIVIPNRPKITDGIPASRLIICLMGATSFFGQNL